MKRTTLMAAFLAALYFLMAFNAYACLIPLYGNVQVEKGSDCAMPKGPPVRDACDSFKALGVQTVSSVQPLPDFLIHVVAGEMPAITILDPTISLHHEFSGSPPFLDRDPLSLTSILRI